MKHAITAGVVALATATLVLGATNTAHAEQVSVNDRTGDVWRTPRSDGPGMVEAGSTLNGDIDRTVVDHGVDSLTITMTYARLAQDKVALQSKLLVRTDAGVEYTAGAFARPGQWEGGQMFWRSSVAPARVPATPDETCPGMTHGFNWHRDTVTVEIPRSCVGDPSWVRVKSLALSARPNGDRTWFDNGHNRGHGFPGWTSRVDAAIPTVH